MASQKKRNLVKPEDPTKPLPRCKSLVVWRLHPIEAGKKKLVRTICDLLRELYREAEKRNDLSTMDRLETANDMAKRMQNKLKFYSMKYGKKKNPVTMVIDNVGSMFWLAKDEYIMAEARARKRQSKKGTPR